ncbi:MAG: hypothetical protein P8Y01_15820 [Woeseiaceae bacterium]|jgi:hypothetical protein
MLDTAAGKPASLTDTGRIERRSESFAFRKIWIPKSVYDALPWFYVSSGIAAFLATLYISEWFWVLPHYVLFSVACVHLGAFVFRRRRRTASDDA